MSKQDLSEADICERYVSPALQAAGWKKNQIRREYTFTADRVIVQGQMVTRGKQKRADYLLFYRPNQPIALIEAKITSLVPDRKLSLEKLQIMEQRREMIINILFKRSL